MNIYGLWLCVLLTSLFSKEVIAERVGHFIGLHGLAESDEHNERAQRIFSVLSNINNLDITGTKLYILADKHRPWSKALEDKHVVLSKAGVDLIYSSSELETADAWMAFILSHELAHIGNADLWPQTQHRTRRSSSSPVLNKVYEGLYRGSQDLDQSRNQEIKADLDGFLLSTLAGYNTSRLFGSELNNRTVLERWRHETSVATTHLRAGERLQLLQENFNTLHVDVALFEYGIKLAYFGRFEDALLLLRRYQQQFPSTAVTNNLAYVYLQLARKEMPTHLAYQFWFPTLLEMNAQLPYFDRPRSYGDEIPAQAKDYLGETVLLLERLPGFRMGLKEYLNLAVAYWYLDEMSKARAVVDEALKSYPDDAQLIGLGALVVLGQGTADASTLIEAKGILESLIAAGNTDSNIRFNLARMLSDRERHGDAKKHWAHLVAHAGTVAPPYLAIACHMLKSNRNCVGDSPPLPRVATAVSIGSDVGHRPVKNILSDWNRLPELLPNVRIYENGKGDSLLALNNVVEFYTSGNPPWNTARKLTNLIGLPDSISPMMRGELWSYGDGWSALIQDDRVSEVWIAKVNN